MDSLVHYHDLISLLCPAIFPFHDVNVKCEFNDCIPLKIPIKLQIQKPKQTNKKLVK